MRRKYVQHLSLGILLPSTIALESEFVDDVNDVDFKNMKLSSGTSIDLSTCV